jgi:hypothetical protein
MLAIVALVALSPIAHADPEREKDIAIEVGMQGDLIVVNVSLAVPVTPGEAWEVLTDYDRMADFLPNLESSRKIASGDNKFQVAQKGTAFFGPFSFSFDSVREITLMPYTEIHSRSISGSFQRSDGFTQLIPGDNGTRIVYYSETLPNVRLPRGITIGMTKRLMRDQFEKMQLEMLRRKAAR